MGEHNNKQMPFGLKIVVILAIVLVLFYLSSIILVTISGNLSLDQFLLANIYAIFFGVLLIINIISLIKLKKWARTLGIITFLLIGIVYFYIGLTTIMNFITSSSGDPMSIIFGLIGISISTYLIFSKKVKEAFK